MATAKAPAAAKASTTKAKKPATGEQLPMIFVRSRGKHFYRAGMKFTEHGHGIALDALTEAQLEAIRNEPELIVEDGTVDPVEVEG